MPKTNQKYIRYNKLLLKQSNICYSLPRNYCKNPSVGGIILHELEKLQVRHYLLKSVNSNFTLEVHSPKINQAKTHFLSHFEGKKEKKYG